MIYYPFVALVDLSTTVYEKISKSMPCTVKCPRNGEDLLEGGFFFFGFFSLTSLLLPVLLKESEPWRPLFLGRLCGHMYTCVYIYTYVPQTVNQIPRSVTLRMDLAINPIEGTFLFKKLGLDANITCFRTKNRMYIKKCVYIEILRSTGLHEDQNIQNFMCVCLVIV